MRHIWLVVFAAALAVSLGIDFLFPGTPAHDGFWWSHIPGFFTLFGFAACIIIVVISKLLGHYWLQRKEDYYDRNDRDK